MEDIRQTIHYIFDVIHELKCHFIVGGFMNTWSIFSLRMYIMSKSLIRMDAFKFPSAFTVI
jgi:hypothetical protein